MFSSALTFTLLTIVHACMRYPVQIHNLNKYWKYTLNLNSNLPRASNIHTWQWPSPSYLKVPHAPNFGPTSPSPKQLLFLYTHWHQLLSHQNQMVRGMLDGFSFSFTTPNTSNALQSSANKAMAFPIPNLHQLDFLHAMVKHFTFSLPSVSKCSCHWL